MSDNKKGIGETRCLFYFPSLEPIKSTLPRTKSATSIDFFLYSLILCKTITPEHPFNDEVDAHVATLH